MRLPGEGCSTLAGSQQEMQGTTRMASSQGPACGNQSPPSATAGGETWQLLKLLEGRGQGSRVPFCKRQCHHCGCGDDSLPRRWEVWKLHLCCVRRFGDCSTGKEIT